MKISLLNKLVCPLCKENLNLTQFEKNDNDLIIKNGILTCNQCKVIYPIINYIPIMLDFTTNVATEFLEENSERIGQYNNFTLPNNEPRPGEVYVQKAFSKQWKTHGTEERVQYGYNEDELRLFIKIQLGFEPEWFKCKTLLNVGCGAGREAMMIQEYTKSTVVGVDLNFSLLQLGEKTLSYPDIHFIQASLFNLPFREREFDYVFSHGVIHHTYSTEKALKSISKYVKNTGYLYIWVYGIRRATNLVNGLYIIFVQYFLRPKISKLPTKLQRMALFPIVMGKYFIQNLKYFTQKNNLGIDKTIKPDWKNIWLETSDSHAIYYSHWQSMAEVIVWLKEIGMSNITSLEIEKIPRHLWHSWRANVGLRSQYIEESK